MEQQSQDQQETSLFELQVDQNSAANLASAASWAKFIAIVCFIGMGLLIIAFIAMKDRYVAAFGLLFSGSVSSAGTIIMVAMLLALVIITLLMILLLKGAVLIKRGIQTSDQQTFNSGLASFKNYFTMYGVIAIIALLLKLLGLISKY